MAKYLNMPINYKFMMRFDYHDNLLKKMRNLKPKIV